MGTAPDVQGRGIATAILATMLRWAWEHGATHAYSAGRCRKPLRDFGVYRKFGFVDAYTYHYRGRPGECH